jgi:hypothetical protein
VRRTACVSVERTIGKLSARFSTVHATVSAESIGRERGELKEIFPNRVKISQPQISQINTDCFYLTTTSNSRTQIFDTTTQLQFVGDRSSSFQSAQSV